MSTKSPNVTMSKQAQILALYDGVRTTREIADIVGCGMSYVRVVARQRKGRSMSEIDIRYLTSERGRATTRARRPRELASLRARHEIAKATGDRAAARAAAAAARRAAREGGATGREAETRASVAYRQAMFASADDALMRERGREAYHAAKGATV